MADTLEIRLGGQYLGCNLRPGDLDFSELGGIVSDLESAASIEAGFVRASRGDG